MGLMDGYRGVIVGIANERSLAYAIAKAARSEGARLCVTYQNERLRGRVEALASELEAESVMPLDLTVPEQLHAVVAQLAERWGSLDFAVHGVAYALREELDGRFIDTSRQGFMTALEVSAYSLVDMARALEPLLRASEREPSILTLTHYGSQKAVPNYNVMGVAKAALEASVRYLAADMGPGGVRVNALSAGAVKTLSAAGIKGLRRMLAHTTDTAPLRRNITADDVGQAALFPLSRLGRGTTGEVFYVDGGYNTVAAAPSAPQGESS